MTAARSWASARTAWRIASSLARRRFGFGLEVVVPYDGGRSRIVADLRTALGLALYRYGFRAPEIELMRELLQPGDTFVDGGANVGLFALVAARCVGASGRVVCFEPASATRSVLSRNVALNDYRWIEVRRDALGESEGHGEFRSFEGDRAGLSSFAPAIIDTSTSEDVTIATLDSALGQHLDAVRLVKLDLEGSEVKALRGATRLMAQGPDLIIEVEPAHLERQNTSVAELVGLLERAGYRLYEIAASAEGFELADCAARSAAGVNIFATRRAIARCAHGDR
jgi:FkbM family methyltransferase